MCRDYMRFKTDIDLKMRNTTHSLDAPLVIRDEREEFLSEQKDKGGGGLWKSQHFLQNSQHTFPTKT